MPNLQVVICSTRPGRVGKPVGDWFFQEAKTHGRFEAELVDLKEVNLPLFDEPQHPRFQKYEHPHTKAWSQTVSRADAFVFVTPEYNYNPPATLINAVDYLLKEWACKPCGFVSYGGVSGGTRSVQASKLLLTAVKMMPLPEAVHIPFVQKALDENGRFSGGPTYASSVKAMLDELFRWAEALKVLR